MPLCASGMVAGALSGALISPHSVTIFIAVAVCAAAAVGAHCLRRRRPIALFSAGVAALLFGIALSQARVLSLSRIDVPLDTSTRILCEGEVLHPPIARAWGVEIDTQLHACAVGPQRALRPVRGAVRLQAAEGAGDLLPGERARFRVRFFTARENKNPGSFSYRSYLRVHGIGAMGRVYGGIERISKSRSPMARVEALRRRIVDAIAERIAPPGRGIVIALAVGDRTGIEPEVRRSFAETGLAHLLAISGLHVGSIALFLYLLSRLIFWRCVWLINRIPVRVLSVVAMLPAIWAYILLTGVQLSAVRAGIMLTVFLAGMLLWRRQDLLSSLAVAVVVILLLWPLSVLDVSFQLSVAAVLGIIVMAPRMIEWWDRSIGRDGLVRRCLRILWATLAVSAAATLATLPIVAYHFKLVTGIGLLANLIAVPLAGALLSPLVAVATVVEIGIPGAATVLWQCSGMMAALLIWFAQRAADVGNPLVFRWAPSIPEALLIASAIAAVVFWRRLPYRRAAAAAIAACIAIDAGYFRVFPMLTDELQITIIDVGQGDSILVRFPRGRTLLIDGGGIRGSLFDVGKNVLAPALWRMGVYQIDWILLSHPHHDHYRGLGYIAERFHPELVWTNGLEAPESEADDWGRFKRQLADTGVPLVTVGGEGVGKEVSGVRLRIVRPPEAGSGDLNDTSLIVDIRYGARRILFVGDLTQAGEQELVKGGADLRADLLKVGHHGSADASSDLFLEVVRPTVAAISAGEHNQYGVPSRQALARLERRGARVYRTDLDGAITIATDGEDLEVETFVTR